MTSLTNEDVQHDNDGEEKKDHHHRMECDAVACESVPDLVIVAALHAPKK